MNETAEDILNRNKELWAAATSIIVAIKNSHLPATFETYQLDSLLEDWFDYLKELTEKREKEIADKAWEAGQKYGEMVEHHALDDHEPDKETFMEELFKYQL